MTNRIWIIAIFTCSQFVFGQVKVTEINFLDEYGLNYNAAGPIITRTDSTHDRLAILNTNSSMISVINCRDHKVTNIPVGSRGIQHLKNTSMIIDNLTGIIYAAGKKSLLVVFPKQETSKTYALDKQYEMVAVDEHTGDAFLVGRESKDIACLDLSNGRISYISWLDHEENMMNLNQTPPPSIRKIVYDQGLNRLIAVDGYTSALSIFDTKKKKRISQKKLNLESGGRWHYAGYNQKLHTLYLVIENNKRQVKQAAKIDITGSNDIIVDMPAFTEGVGISYNPKLDEIYIPYDNHASVHVIDFKKGGELTEIILPLYGNDATAIDIQHDILYVSNWAYGEIEVIDLKTRRFTHRIPDLGIIPHMLNLSYNPRSEKLYFPKGATAVNGTFGSAVTALDPKTGETEKIYTGWTPRELIQLPGRDEFLVFNAEDHVARVRSNGSYDMFELPFDYPVQAAYTKTDNIYLSYGPHQSYWPDVYIWGAKDGILQIDSHDFRIMDRRIPRMAQRIVVDTSGTLYALQNSWGEENQFLTVLEDPIREFDAGKRIVLDSKIQRETSQRILEYDENMNGLYLVKAGETDMDNGRLQVINLQTRKMKTELETGLNPVDLYFDSTYIYVSNFDENSVSRIDKNSYVIEKVKTGKEPLKIAGLNNSLYVINHGSNTLQCFGVKEKKWKIPVEGRPDNLFVLQEKLIITSHNADAFNILSFNPAGENFSHLFSFRYPYGETGFDTHNSSFYLSGQFGDAIYELNRMETDSRGRLWITDFLSGRLFILTGI